MLQRVLPVYYYDFSRDEGLLPDHRLGVFAACSSAGCGRHFALDPCSLHWISDPCATDDRCFAMAHIYQRKIPSSPIGVNFVHNIRTADQIRVRVDPYERVPYPARDLLDSRTLWCWV